MRALALPHAAAVALTATAVVATAAAQSGDAVRQADSLFREGRDAMRRHAYIEACSKFRESDALDPSPGTRLNWALCDEQVGHLAEALLHARWALERLDPGDNRQPIAARLTADLEGRVPHLTVRLPPEISATAKVYLDGEPLAIRGAEETLAVDPGQHTLFVEQPSHEAGRIVVTLKEGDNVVREVSPGSEWRGAGVPTETPPNESSPPRRPAWTLRRTVGVALAGGAAAGLATAVTTLVLALNERSTVQRECLGGLCTPVGFDAADRGRTFVHASGVSLTLSAAAAAAAAVLLWPRKAPIGISAVPQPQGAAVTVVRRF